MIEIEPLIGTTVDMEGKPVPYGVRPLTSARVNHYSDVIDYLVNTELARCAEENFVPTADQIRFYKKELARMVTIRSNIENAQQLRIQKSGILNETDCIHTRVKL